MLKFLCLLLYNFSFLILSSQLVLLGIKAVVYPLKHVIFQVSMLRWQSWIVDTVHRVSANGFKTLDGNRIALRPRNWLRPVNVQGWA